jgi:hypothetical protein
VYEDDIVIDCTVFVLRESASVWVVRIFVGEVRPQCVIDRYVIVFSVLLLRGLDIYVSAFIPQQ